MTDHAPDDPSILPEPPADELDFEKTRLLFQNTGLGQVLSVVNGGVLVYVFAQWAPPLWALGWWATVTVVAGYRYLTARQFLAAVPAMADIGHWRRRALFGAAVAGLLWGGGAVAFMVLGSPSVRLLVALIASGMVAGAVPLLSSVPAAFRAYMGPLLAGIIGAALHAGDWVLAFVAAVFLFAVMRSARHFHDALDRSIRLGLRMRLMAEHLNDARRDAEAASVAKGRFLSNVSHELRTPMNGVIGMTDLLLDTPLQPEQRQYAETIRDSADSLLKVINDILDFSRMESGNRDAESSDFDLAAAIEAAVRSRAAEAEAKQLQLDRQLDPRLAIPVRGDPVGLRQAVDKLLGNAIKFTPAGRVSLRADRLARDDGRIGLRLTVSDTGIGIPADRRDQLFAPFTQVDASAARAYGGTGLGLSICRQLVQQMQGEIGLDSEPGQGSTFWFTAVFNPAAVAAPPAQAAVFDSQEMLKNLGGDRDIARLLVEQLLADLPQRLVALEAALAAEDQETARREAHTIKGQAASGAALPLRDQAREIELHCKEGRLAEAADRLPGLESALAAAARAWQEFLGAAS